MSKISLIILAAGNSARFESGIKKQWLRIDELPLWKFVTQNLSKLYEFEKVIITSSAMEARSMENYLDNEIIVLGGDTRQASLKNAMALVDSEFVMVSDVARACIPSEVIHSIIESRYEADCIVPFLHTSDTTILGTVRVNRDDIKLIQTPQLSRTNILKNALESEVDFTDDSGAIEAIGGSVKYISGSSKSVKLTRIDDLSLLKCLKKPSQNVFCGFGYDVHQFENNKQMVLGGVLFESDFGFRAHSDGDVLIHSLIDALLGACGAGDIGEFFPDYDEQYKNADSKELLKIINRFIKNIGYEICNIDVSIVAEVPKITPLKMQIKSKLSEILEIEKFKINIKATTNEKMGFVGRREGVAVYSTALLKFYDWTRSEV